MKDNAYETIMDKAFDDLLGKAAENVSKEEIDNMLNKEMPRFSDEHNKQMEKIFKKYRNRQIINKLPQYGKRAAAIILALALASGVSISSVRAWRMKFWKMITEKTSIETTIKIDEKTKNENVYSNKYITMAYIPDGFATTDENIGSYDSFSVDFQKNDDYFTMSIQPITGTTSIDTEKGEVENIQIRGHKGFLSKKDDIIIVFWHDDERQYVLSGNIDTKEIIKIAENIF